MARAKSSVLAVKKSRLALPVSKKPIFESLGDGVSVGYRRNASAGTWIVRKSDGKGGSTQRVIGQADDYAEPDGEHVLSWSQAQQRALALAEGSADVSPASRLTVTEAVDAYERDLTARKGDLGNVQRLRYHLSKKLAGTVVAELTAPDLRRWRDGLLSKLAPATVNRTANALRAALSLAAKHNHRIINATAWKHGLAGLPDAEEARNVVLSDDAVKRIIEAAYRHSDAFGLVVEIAAVTGARYSQITRMTVGDLQAGAEPRLMMPASKKGKGVKKVPRYPVPLPAGLAVRLEAAGTARGAGRDAPLVVKPGGAPWAKSDHTRPFARAVVVAGFAPEDIAPHSIDDITIYALRHSSIVRGILRGVPVRVVAVQHDTSVAMIERHYSKELAHHADALARVGMLDTDSTPANVVRLGTR